MRWRKHSSSFFRRPLPRLFSIQLLDMFSWATSLFLHHSSSSGKTLRQGCNKGLTQQVGVVQTLPISKKSLGITSKILEYLGHLSVFVYLGPRQSQIVCVNSVIHGMNLGPCGISVISERVGDWVMKVNYVDAKCPYDQSPRTPWTPKPRWVLWLAIVYACCYSSLLKLCTIHLTSLGEDTGSLCLVSPGLSPLLILLCILLLN